MSAADVAISQPLPSQLTVMDLPEQFMEPQQMSLSNFEKIEKIGEGTFGQVYKGEYTNPETGEKKIIALKKLNMINEKDGFPITALREIKYLKQLNHENIVRLEDILSSKPNRRNKFRGSFYLVFEYLKHDLQGLIDKKVHFELAHLKCIMIQILKGMIYLHNQNVIHRDIKGANILIGQDGTVKLADFGLARIYFPNNRQAQYTNRVVTLWYRPPELLLGARNYSDTLDIWSLGCVFAELFLPMVLFNGDKEERQIELIYDKCGSISEENWPGVSELKGFKDFGPKKKYLRRLKEFLIKESNGKQVALFQCFFRVTECLADLIDKMLTMDPKRRLTAVEALNHEFFSTSPAPSLKSQQYFVLLIFCRIPLLDEDYHEFIVKSEKKMKVNFKKKFAFHKPVYDINDPTYRDFWKPSLDAYSKKGIIQAAPIPLEEQKLMGQTVIANPLDLKPFAGPQVQQRDYKNPHEMKNLIQQKFGQRADPSLQQHKEQGRGNSPKRYQDRKDYRQSRKPEDALNTSKPYHESHKNPNENIQRKRSRSYSKSGSSSSSSGSSSSSSYSSSSKSKSKHKKSKTHSKASADSWKGRKGDPTPRKIEIEDKKDKPYPEKESFPLPKPTQQPPISGDQSKLSGQKAQYAEGSVNIRYKDDDQSKMRKPTQTTGRVQYSEYLERNMHHYENRERRNRERDNRDRRDEDHSHRGHQGQKTDVSGHQGKESINKSSATQIVTAQSVVPKEQIAQTTIQPPKKDLRDLDFQAELPISQAVLPPRAIIAPFPEPDLPIQAASIPKEEEKHVQKDRGEYQPDYNKSSHDYNRGQRKSSGYQRQSSKEKQHQPYNPRDKYDRYQPKYKEDHEASGTVLSQPTRNFYAPRSSEFDAKKQDDRGRYDRDRRSQERRSPTDRHNYQPKYDDKKYYQHDRRGEYQQHHGSSSNAPTSSYQGGGYRQNEGYQKRQSYSGAQSYSTQRSYQVGGGYKGAEDRGYDDKSQYFDKRRSQADKDDYYASRNEHGRRSYQPYDKKDYSRQGGEDQWDKRQKKSRSRSLDKQRFESQKPRRPENYQSSKSPKGEDEAGNSRKDTQKDQVMEEGEIKRF